MTKPILIFALIMNSHDWVVAVEVRINVGGGTMQYESNVLVECEELQIRCCALLPDFIYLTMTKEVRSCLW